MNKNSTHTPKGRGAPETPQVIWEMPAWAADTLRNSLELDARSASATPDLRAEIRRALSAIVEVQL